MFEYEVKYKINDMVILQILRDYSLKQNDLSICNYTDTELFVNFRPWNETIHIHKGILILTECGNSIPSDIVDSIEQYCTLIVKPPSKYSLENKILLLENAISDFVKVYPFECSKDKCKECLLNTADIFGIKHVLCELISRKL